MPATIPEPTDDATVNLVMDTLNKKKQALVFVNSKRSAEKTAEDICRQIKQSPLIELSEKTLNVLSRPTKQCERLANCIKHGIAFHHAGLHHQQKEMIEDAFRDNSVKIICATTTLAWGLDLPAYRTVLKDLRRYTGHGLDWIPTLEYLQMAGRAGRPKFDNEGEAIAVARTKIEKEKIEQLYINGEPEEIYSKLAVEPVLRMYLLSLISTEFVTNKQQILDFFEKTFWAFQFKDMDRLQAIIEKMLKLLEEFEFIKIHSANKDFVSADELNKDSKISSTLIGKRVAQLYIDPLTAYSIIESLRRAMVKKPREVSYLHVISNTIEMRPLLKIKVKEYDDIQEKLITYEPWLLESPPSLYDSEYDDYLSSLKTALMLLDWVNEDDEETLLEKYAIRPGELNVKLNNADWLLYSSEELAKLLGFQRLVTDIVKLRLRIKYGVKEELLALLQLKQIGRVRARKLFKNRITSLGDLRKTDIKTLSQLIGARTAAYVKEQLGQKVEAVKEGKRKGQVSLKGY